MKMSEVRRYFTVVAVATVILVFAPAAPAQLNCNAGVEHYPGGGIKQCTLNGDHTLYTTKGLRVTCSSGKTLVQHPNGAVESCTIDRNHTFGELHCSAPARVEFEADGRLRSCRRG